MNRTDLVTIVQGQNDFYDDLVQFSPNSVPGVYNDRNEFIPQVIPGLVHYRYAAAKEKVALLDTVARMYSVDGDVTMNDRSERGLTDRTRMEVDRDIIINDRSERSMTERNDRSESGMSERARIEHEEKSKRAMIHSETMALKFATDYAIVKEIQNRKIQVSRNDFEARKYEVGIKAYAKIAAENIRKKARLGVATRELYGLIAKARSEILLGEIEAETIRYGNRSKVVEQYVERRAELTKISIQAEVDFEISRNQLKGLLAKEDTRRQNHFYSSLEKINTDVSRLLTDAMNNGYVNPNYTISTPYGTMNFSLRSDRNR